MKRFLAMMATLLMGGGLLAQEGPSAFKSQDNADFAKTIADKRVQLVDVRTPGEFAAGHIPGAANMDVNGSDFDKQTSTLDKSRPVALYCRSGARSKAAAKKLVAKGFNVYELNRGVMNWDGAIAK